MRNMHSDPTTQDFVTRVEAGIKSAGITVDEFCKAARVNRATWQRWKSGKHHPHPSSVMGMERLLDEMVRAIKSGEAA
jgi:transcriptional regulator with XRE-family HTH domain